MSSRLTYLAAVTITALFAACNSPQHQAEPLDESSPLFGKSFGGDDTGPTVKAVKTRQSLDEKMLFYPAKYPAGDWQPEGLGFQDVWFESADGTKLHGWYCPVANPRAHVLYAHGNAGNLSSRAQLLKRFQQRHRISVFIFDYRGYGRSEGTVTAAGAIADSQAAWDTFAKRANILPREVVLMGRSLGGAIVIQLSAGAEPRGLILESTFSSLRDIGKHHYPALAWLVSRRKLNSLERIAAYRGPLLQSHGDKDQTIPLAMGRKLYAAARGSKTFVGIAGGDHNSPQSEEYYRELDVFLDGLPPPAGR